MYTKTKEPALAGSFVLFPLSPREENSS